MRCFECGWIPTPGCFIKCDDPTRGPWYCPKCNASLGEIYNKKESKMKVKVTKKIVVEMTKEETEYLIKDKILEQTGINLGEARIVWIPSYPSDKADQAFIEVTIEEPLDG